MYAKDSDLPWEPREQAIYGLSRHGAAAVEAVPTLIRELEFVLAPRAADALGCIGSGASAAVQALLKALESRGRKTFEIRLPGRSQQSVRSQQVPLCQYCWTV